MISIQDEFNLSPLSVIYDLIVPKNNLLRQINDLVDFSFVFDELQSSYCHDNGRMAICPIRMFKYLLLKSIYKLSDVDVVERSQFDMSFKYFLNMTPEEDVINPSSLTKFRRGRLKDNQLMDLLISKTIEIALEKDVIKSRSIIVDSTHTNARYNHKTANQFLQEKSKAVRKAVYQLNPDFKEKFPTKPCSSDVEEELTYCRRVIEAVEQHSDYADIPVVKERLNVLKETIEDFTIELSYSNDKDARFGHKTADHSFFGYKTHIAMNEERLITAAIITTGNKNDGKHLQELVEKSKLTGVKVDTVIGDTAYSAKENIAYTKERQIELVSKLHPIISNGIRSNNEDFVFNKDAGTYSCKAGHLAKNIKREITGQNKRNPRTRYMFDVEKCKVCPFKKGCYKNGAKSKSFYVAQKSTEHQEQMVFQESDQFKKMARERYKIEAKNSELKQRHGYKKAIASGLFGMQIQGAATIFVVNLKRIIKLMNEK
ncbi:IS1182 family transposase [Sporosarcina siberiensis]|uniref:IS1182 family transposase n=1 Tax=Sporosarcina siberiensis TaxID=1365606 RepID=A0ABW4SJF5_9BACL